MAYQQRPELAQKANFYRPNIFRVSDNEIYMIKDSNLKKSSQNPSLNKQVVFTTTKSL